jgi:hypothetical protein
MMNDKNDMPARDLINLINSPDYQMVFLSNEEGGDNIMPSLDDEKIMHTALTTQAKIDSGECVLVPKEPTEDMTLKGMTEGYIPAVVSQRSEDYAELKYDNPRKIMQFGREVMTGSVLNKVYKAMLKSAPDVSDTNVGDIGIKTRGI